MPRVFDKGRYYKVCVSESEVDRWRRNWPASGLPDDQGICAEFDKKNGDLVDHDIPEDMGEGSGAALAIIDDLQCIGEAWLDVHGGWRPEDVIRHCGADVDDDRSATFVGFGAARGGGDAAASRRCPRDTQVQSLLFDKSKFTVAQANKWAKSHGFEPTKKLEVGPTRIHVRVQSPKACKVVGTIPMGAKDVLARVCCPKPRSKARR